MNQQEFHPITLTCGCVVHVTTETGEMEGFDRYCGDGLKLFRAVLMSPTANHRECAERDALRAHADAHMPTN